MERITAVKTVQQSFAISAQLCVLKYSEKANILQIATHGFGFDKTYAA